MDKCTDLFSPFHGGSFLLKNGWRLPSLPVISLASAPVWKLHKGLQSDPMSSCNAVSDCSEVENLYFLHLTSSL